jgi:hypothetical protein
MQTPGGRCICRRSCLTRAKHSWRAWRAYAQRRGPGLCRQLRTSTKDMLAVPDPRPPDPPKAAPSHCAPSMVLLLRQGQPLWPWPSRELPLEQSTHRSIVGHAPLHFLGPSLCLTEPWKRTERLGLTQLTQRVGVLGTSPAGRPCWFSAASDAHRGAGVRRPC